MELRVAYQRQPMKTANFIPVNSTLYGHWKLQVMHLNTLFSTALDGSPSHALLTVELSFISSLNTNLYIYFYTIIILILPCLYTCTSILLLCMNNGVFTHICICICIYTVFSINYFHYIVMNSVIDWACSDAWYSKKMDNLFLICWISATLDSIFFLPALYIIYIYIYELQESSENHKKKGGN